MEVEVKLQGNKGACLVGGEGREREDDGIWGGACSKHIIYLLENGLMWPGLIKRSKRETTLGGGGTAESWEQGGGRKEFRYESRRG